MNNKRLFLSALSVLLATVIGSPALSAQGAGDFMQGSPPLINQRVSKSNWYVGPYNRWGLQHVREITATIEIPRGEDPVFPLPEMPLPISSIAVEKIDGTPGTIFDWLEASYTDGFLVLHRGHILSEIYMNSMTERSYHNFFSMSKSFTGNLAGILAVAGQLDTGAKINHYVPEMNGGAYGDATVRQLLDMTIGIEYSEDYDDPKADIYAYAAASNANDNPEGLTLYGVLPTLKKAGVHGKKFHYVTANTDALGWVLQRASNRHLAEMLTTEIWSKLGAERDAYVISDLDRTPWMGGGLNTTLRDAARFGFMMSNKGSINGKQVVPASYIKDIQENAIPTGYPGGYYRNQWWVNKGFRSFSARGVAGQRIFIVPDSELVIVKFSSWPALSGYHPEGKGKFYDERALQAIANYLKQQ